MTGRLGLIADIGGTNARFALTDLAAASPTVDAAESLPNAGFASLQHAAEHYLARVGVQPAHAAIAVASPIAGDEVRMTNRAWSFSQAELRQALGLDSLRVLNDFGAIAWSIPHLAAEHCVTLHGEHRMPPAGPVSVLGPGTGLGVALVVGDADGGWRIVETEGGHVSFAPIGDEEQRIARWLTARFGRTSNERLLSGAGLSHVDAVLRGVDVHAAMTDRGLLRSPPEVTAAALDGHDVPARQTLARFCAVLGSVAGDVALVHGARTVMIAGGIVPRFIPFLKTSAFRERFLSKGRFGGYLEGVAVHVVTHPLPGLLGAAVALRESVHPVGVIRT